MQIKNGRVFCADGTFHDADVFAEGDRIAAAAGGETLDAKGCIVAPGFVDCHIHGAHRHDFCEGTDAANGDIAAYLASVGVTSYLGTTMAMEKDVLRAILKSAKHFMDVPEPGRAVMRGVNLEGPFASKEKKGAMQETLLLLPDFDFLCELDALCGGRIIFADVAPELPGGMDFVRAASEKYVVSIAHSAADYDTAKEAFLNGASHVTHLYNAMMPFSHRAPGLIGAAMDYARDVELISDGIHVHPSAVRAAFRLFGDDRVCLISDAMMACGMPNGAYELGGQDVTVKDGLATLANGTIAGSATPLSECFRRAVKEFDIPLVSALKAATINPARAARLDGDVGSIAVGKRADFTLLDGDTLRVRHCVVGGALVF
ncbi:MAG: N-acetylglucosamine-6-phosphate deacetylase [Oscillospiraceae bacterium]|nr:N-acetylglucosamine-6-phosphate deacetylase [Oscillospiraceae bacterium]